MSSILSVLEFPHESRFPIFQVEWYQQLPVFALGGKFNSFTPIKVNTTKLLDSGSHHSVIYRIHLTIQHKEDQSEQVLDLIAKIGKASDAISQDSARELLLYRDVLQKIAAEQPTTTLDNNNTKATRLNVPQYIHGDQIDIDGCQYKFLLITYTFALPCSFFYGNISPHNRGKDLASITSKFPNLSAFEITNKAFAAISHVHAKFWQNLSHDLPEYLPGYSLYTSTTPDTTQYEIERNKYEQFVNAAVNNFSRRTNNRQQCTFSPFLLDIIHSVLNRSTWDAFFNYNKTQPFTLCHGDFFPANVMVASNNNNDDEVDIFLIDFELSLVSHPTQDLTQYVISHLDPKIRQEKEQELLLSYYNNLCTNFSFYHKNAPNLTTIYPFEALWNDYIIGCSKWIWLICMCCDWDFIPDVLLQHFIDQTTHFLQTHNITTTSPIFLKPT